MTDDLSRVLREAQAAASGRGDNVVEQLASKVGMHAGASAVFGDPIEREGITVVPVAKIRWGFGGGSGRGIDEGSETGEIGEGAGGGGGVMASPLGFIEISEGRAEFRRTTDPTSAVPIIVASGVAAWLCLRGLRKLFRS
ncbi:MAG: spore germination protein GerW family protein [bacterium]